jgi:hypothetical protein
MKKTDDSLTDKTHFTDKSKNNYASNLEDKDIFKMALDIRNLEISLFWQRSNYFLVLNLQRLS